MAGSDWRVVGRLDVWLGPAAVVVVGWRVAVRLGPSVTVVVVGGPLMCHCCRGRWVWRIGWVPTVGVIGGRLVWRIGKTFTVP